MSTQLEITLAVDADLLRWSGQCRRDGVLLWSFTGTPLVSQRNSSAPPHLGHRKHLDGLTATFLRRYEPSLPRPDVVRDEQQRRLDPMPDDPGSGEDKDAHTRRVLGWRLGDLLAPSLEHGPQPGLLITQLLADAGLEPVELLVRLDPRLGNVLVEYARLPGDDHELGLRHDVDLLRLPFAQAAPFETVSSPDLPRLLYLRLHEEMPPAPAGLDGDGSAFIFASRTALAPRNVGPLLERERPDVLVVATHGRHLDDVGLQFAVDNQWLGPAAFADLVCPAGSAAPSAVVLPVCHGAAVGREGEPGVAARLAERVPYVFASAGRYPLDLTATTLRAVAAVLRREASPGEVLRELSAKLGASLDDRTSDDWVLPVLYGRGAGSSTGLRRALVRRRRGSWPINLGDALVARRAEGRLRLPVPGSALVTISVAVSPHDDVVLAGLPEELQPASATALMRTLVPRGARIVVTGIEGADADKEAVLPALALAVGQAVGLSEGAVLASLIDWPLLHEAGGPAWLHPGVALLDDPREGRAAVPAPVEVPPVWLAVPVPGLTVMPAHVHVNLPTAGSHQHWAEAVAAFRHSVLAATCVTGVPEELDGAPVLLRRHGIAVGAQEEQLLRRRARLLPATAGSESLLRAGAE